MLIGVDLLFLGGNGSELAGDAARSRLSTRQALYTRNTRDVQQRDAEHSPGIMWLSMHRAIGI